MSTRVRSAAGDSVAVERAPGAPSSPARGSALSLEAMRAWLFAEQGQGRFSFLRWALPIILLGIWVHWPAMTVGWFSDDYAQQGMIHNAFPMHREPWDLYSFMRDDPEEQVAMRNAGLLPWWSAPGLRAAVFRPVASASLWLDYAIAPRRPLIHHIHTMVWWALLCLIAAYGYHRWLPRAAAPFALLFLAVDPLWVFPIGWIANRCSIMCGAFSLLALIIHVQRREEGRGAGAMWLEGIALVLAVGSGEYGLAIGGALLLWELLLAKDNLRERAFALVPFTLVAVAYLSVHRSLHYGTSIPEVYADPFNSPVAYLAHASRRLPMLATELYSGMPASFGDFAREMPESVVRWFGVPWGVFDVQDSFLVAGSIVLFVVVVPGLVLTDRCLQGTERSTFRWLALSSLLALVPVSAAPAHARLLVMASLTSAPALAVVVLIAARGASSLSPLRWLGTAAAPASTKALGRLRLVARVCLGLLVVGALARHVAFDIKRTRRDQKSLRMMAARTINAFTLGPVAARPRSLDKRDVVLVNVFDHSTSAFGKLAAPLLGLGSPRSWQPLAISLHPMLMKRKSQNSFELTVVGDGTWMGNDLERFFRSPSMALPAGTKIRHGIFEVLVVDDVGGLPKVVEFTFPDGLEGDTLSGRPPPVFVVSTVNGLEIFTLPTVGKMVPIPIPHLPELELK